MILHWIGVLFFIGFTLWIAGIVFTIGFTLIMSIIGGVMAGVGWIYKKLTSDTTKGDGL